MGCNRREFIKIAGLSTVLGLGVRSAYELLYPGQLEAAGYFPDEKGLEAKRWSMVIDMRKCSTQENCTDCIDACNRIHNIPDFEGRKHEIKWIWKAPYHNTFPSKHNEFIDEETHHMPFMVLCNHCNNPPCVRVCPTQATFKREKDGVVMMDYHRCIGCRFCMAGCPYGSRSFNFLDPRLALDAGTINKDYPTRTKGVVEKCTFCDERIPLGLMPACVEACREKALVFGDLDDAHSNVRELLREHYTIRRKPELGTDPSVFYIV